MGPLWGLCAAWDRSAAAFRKKHKSAACLKEHDLRFAGAGIAEQLLGFIWEGCSWLSCSRVVCYSAVAPWPARTSVVCSLQDQMYLSRWVRQRVQQLLLYLRTKGSSKRPSDLWDKHESLCWKLQDIKTYQLLNLAHILL